MDNMVDDNDMNRGEESRNGRQQHHHHHTCASNCNMV